MSSIWDTLFFGGYGSLNDIGLYVLVICAVYIIFDLIRYYARGGVDSSDWKTRRENRRAKRTR